MDAGRDGARDAAKINVKMPDAAKHDAKPSPTVANLVAPAIPTGDG
jgi:hypothetical protein